MYSRNNSVTKHQSVYTGYISNYYYTETALSESQIDTTNACETYTTVYQQYLCSTLSMHKHLEYFPLSLVLLSISYKFA